MAGVAGGDSDIPRIEVGLREASCDAVPKPWGGGAELKGWREDWDCGQSGAGVDCCVPGARVGWACGVGYVEGKVV